MKWFTIVVCTALAFLLISSVTDLALTIYRYHQSRVFSYKLTRMEDRLDRLPVAAIIKYDQMMTKKLEDLEKHLKKTLDEMEGHLNAMNASFTSRANCISSEDIKGLLKNLLVPYH